MPKEPLAGALLSEMINKKMEEVGMSIRGLAQKLEMSYEHVRRITNAESIPSPRVLKDICGHLKLNYKEAEKLLTADKIRKKYGTIPLELSGKKPGLEPIERVWDQLTPEHQKDAVVLITDWAKRDKAAKVSE